MRGLIAPLVVVSLTACNSAAERAEQEYYTVSEARQAAPSDKCRAARKAADAWLARDDAEKYNEWLLRVNIYC